MYRGETVSVILPTYNERDSIREAIDSLFATNLVDEVVVVNNNAVKGTSEEVAKTDATEVMEEKQGYGFAIQRGFAEAKGDLLILSEPDGTFCGHDIRKLLAYSEDVDVVFGTRTSSTFIWEGANMGLFLKWGNYAVGKLTEFLFNTSILTDVGCTMKLIRRKTLERIQPRFRIGSSHFGPHLMLLVITQGIHFVEVPVNYCQRVGESMVTGSFLKAFHLGMVMIAMVLRARFESWFCPGSIYHARSQTASAEEDDYFETRMPYDPRRAGLWREIVRAWRPYLKGSHRVCDAGAGYCDAINAIEAPVRFALDPWRGCAEYAADGVKVVSGSVTEWPGFDQASLDAVVASNLFEHLTPEELSKALEKIFEVLAENGRLLVLQPNYRLCADHYFDDPTHKQLFDEQSLCRCLEEHGFQMVHVEARFTPFSLRSRMPAWPWLVRFYLALPWRPLAGQMFVVAQKANQPK